MICQHDSSNALKYHHKERFLPQHMEEANIIDVQTLGRWMAENHISRATLASALGLKRSTIDNYFVRNRIPR